MPTAWSTSPGGQLWLPTRRPTGLHSIHYDCDTRPSLRLCSWNNKWYLLLQCHSGNRHMRAEGDAPAASCKATGGKEACSVNRDTRTQDGQVVVGHLLSTTPAGPRFE